MAYRKKVRSFLRKQQQPFRLRQLGPLICASSGTTEWPSGRQLHRLSPVLVPVQLKKFPMLSLGGHQEAIRSIALCSHPFSLYCISYWKGSWGRWKAEWERDQLDLYWWEGSVTPHPTPFALCGILCHWLRQDSRCYGENQQRQIQGWNSGCISSLPHVIIQVL